MKNDRQNFLTKEHAISFGKILPKNHVNSLIKYGSTNSTAAFFCVFHQRGKQIFGSLYNAYICMCSSMENGINYYTRVERQSDDR